MSIKASALELAWERLLLAAFAAGYKLAPSQDRWGDENYGWELTKDDVNIFWLDEMAEPALLRTPLHIPLFDEDASRHLMEALAVSEEMLDAAIG